MTDKARAGEYLTRLAYMTVVMTSKTSRPVTVAYVVRIGRPVHLHGREDISAIDSDDGVNGLVDLGFLIPEDFWEVSGIVGLNRLLNGFFYILLIAVVFHQCV